MVSLEEQIKWEQEMTTRGIDRYRKALADAVKYGDECRVTPQQRLMQDSIEPVAKALAQVKEDLAKPGRKHKALSLVKHMDNQEIALLVSRSIMQGISSKRGYLSMASTIGNLLEEQNAFNDFRRINPGYWEKATKKVRNNLQQTESVKRRALVGYAKHAKVWSELLSTKDKIAVGSYLIKLFADETGLIKIVDLPKQQTIVEMTDKCAAWLKAAHDRCEMLAPVWLPMLTTPNDWNGMYGGGYFTKRIPLIKTPNKGYLDDPLNTPSKEVLSAINLIQRTGWSINTKVFEVAATLWDSGSVVGGLPPRDSLELPKMPCEEDDIEAFKTSFPDEWSKFKAARKETYIQNARLRSHRVATAQTLEAAEELQGKDFYFVWTMDWRGRMYPVAGALSPQGTSLAKGLLQFSEGKPLGDRGLHWLMIQLANSYGVDKVSFEDRIKWVQEHSTQISMSALDPFTFKMWADADSPWEFLAAALEWERYQREGKDMISYLPVRVDGSCNGLQHLSSVLKDQVGCLATNVAPNAKPSDIYAQVASMVSSKVTKDAQHGNELAQVWYGKIDRSVVKRNVMTVSYGATRIGMLEQLREDLGKAHNGKVREWLDLEADAPLFDLFWYLSEAIQDAIGQVVKAAPSVMSWVQDCAVAAADEGLPLRWVTPAGFNVLHAYRKHTFDRIDSVIGKYNIQHRLRVETQDMNSQKTKLAIAPNWVHSLDASHCHQTVVECNKQGVAAFAMVHDSYGCHAADMDVMAKVLRQVFAEMYKGNLMEDLRNQIISQVSPEVAQKIPLAPPQGQFDVETVKDSGYFFA